MTHSSRVTVRSLKHDDRSAWEVLWAGYLDFYRTELPRDVSDLTFARLLDPAEPMHGLVAEADGAVVGIAHYVLHRSTWARELYCYLEDLIVAPEMRGRGAGTALIEAVADAARAVAASRLYWCTHETNTTAQALYDKLGMRTPFIQYRKLL